MNGIRIRSVADIQMILHDYHDMDVKRGPAYITGITILFGVTQPHDPDPDQILFSEQDHATARAVWSIIGSNDLATIKIQEKVPAPSKTIISSSNTTTRVRITGGGTASHRAEQELRTALLPPPEEETIAYVQSIIAASLQFHLPAVVAHPIHNRLRFTPHLSKILAPRNERSYQPRKMD